MVSWNELDGRTDIGNMDKWMNGRMDAGMDGWLDGWSDGWMDGWMVTKIKLLLPEKKYIEENYQR